MESFAHPQGLPLPLTQTPIFPANDPLFTRTLPSHDALLLTSPSLPLVGWREYVTTVETAFPLFKLLFSRWPLEETFHGEGRNHVVVSLGLVGKGGIGMSGIGRTLIFIEHGSAMVDQDSL